MRPRSALLAALVSLAPGVAHGQAMVYSTLEAWTAALAAPAVSLNDPLPRGSRVVCSPFYVRIGPADGCFDAPTLAGFAFVAASLPSGTIGPLRPGPSFNVQSFDTAVLDIYAPPGLTAFAATFTAGPGLTPVSVAAVGVDGTSLGGASFFQNPLTGSSTFFFGIVTNGTPIARFSLGSVYLTGPSRATIAASGITFTATPEPATLALAGAGVALLGAWARRRPA